MPKHFRSLNEITVTAPCNADWNSMRGDDQVRFCDHCQLHVTDLSQMTRQQATRLVEQSRGRLCVRYVQTSAGEILTTDTRRVRPASRRVSQLAAGAFTATMALSTAAAQTTLPKDDDKTAQVSRRSGVTPTTTGGVISGVVQDPNGAVIPGAVVTLTNTTIQSETVTTSSEDGAYEFKDVPAGPYKIKIASPSPAFKELELTNIDLQPGSTKRFESTLELGDTASVTMGVVAIVEPHDALIKAAYKNDLATVLTLLPVTADVNASDKDTSTTALDHAVEHHNLDMVRALVTAGANLNAGNGSGRSPLMSLNDGATVEFVRALISAGADVNARDEQQHTVLMAAAGSCKSEVLQELIRAGANIDTTDDDGYTPLMLAAINPDTRFVKFLIETGVSIDATNKEGESALSLAARNGKGEALRALIDAGAANNLTAGDLDAALLAAVENEDSCAVKVLLDAGASANASASDGKTALMEAASNGKPAAVKALLNAGAEVNSVDKDGWTALMHCEDAESARLLLNAGADLIRKNKTGETALAVAVRSGQEEIVKLLKSRGAPK